MDKAGFQIEGFDQLFDFLFDARAPAFQIRGGGHEHGITQRHVLGNIQKADLAVVDPGFHGEFPAVQVAFHQHREFFVRDGIHFVRRADHAVAETAGLVERFQVNRIVRVAVQLEQRLIHPLEKADHVFTVVGLFENAHANATQLRAPFHQGFVAEQDRLAVQPRVVHQHRVDRPGPFHRLLEQRDRHVDAFRLKLFSDFHGAVVEPFEIPAHEGNVVLFGERAGPVRRHHHKPAVELFQCFDGVQAPAQQGHVTFLRIFLGRHDHLLVSGRP